jgi:hypothetical protein
MHYLRVPYPEQPAGTRTVSWTDHFGSAFSTIPFGAINEDVLTNPFAKA